MSDFIPVNEPLLSGNEKAYLNECIDTGWISSEGPFVKQFEQAFSKKVNRKYGVSVTNGTAALDVAVKALRLKPKSEVILPSFCIISCLQAIIQNDLVPVLVDCEPDTWNMCPKQVADKISDKTGAIMVVHTYGLPVDMKPILSLAKTHHLKIIEDAAEVIGQTYEDAPCGSFGDVSIVSFYPNKHITTGEGGMVLTDDEQIADNAQKFRNLCFEAGARFVHHELGHNYRMTNVQAAIGLAQLELWDTHLQKKRQIGLKYDEAFEGLSGIQRPLGETTFAKNIYWVYGMVLDDGLDRAKITQALSEQGVGWRPFFWPMHEQPVLNKMGYFNDEQYPVCEKIARQGFYIPSGLGLSEKAQQNVIERFKQIMKEYA